MILKIALFIGFTKVLVMFLVSRPLLLVAFSDCLCKHTFQIDIEALFLNKWNITLHV
jgi:hypothetical protein